MADKNLNARIVHKHDVEANWIKATNFIPKQGEIIVYDVDENYEYERIKVGDGTTVISSLPFLTDDLVAQIESVINGDTAIANAEHATSADTATKATQDASGNVITDTYATKTELNSVSELVGDTAVATQIETAVSAKADSNHTHSSIIEQNNGLEQKFWRGTQSEYDAIDVKDDNTMYIIIDGSISSGDENSPVTIGDMSSSIYDPQGKAQDIFAYVDSAIQNSIGTAIGGSY